MKKTVLLITLAAALLPFTPCSQASPEDTAQKKARVVAMCKDKEMRLMLLREMTSTKERKMEVARMLSDDPEFRSLYETMNVNPG